MLNINEDAHSATIGPIIAFRRSDKQRVHEMPNGTQFYGLPCKSVVNMSAYIFMQLNLEGWL